MMITEALSTATRRLAAVADTPRLDAEVLLAHLLGVDRTHLLIAKRHELPSETNAVFTELIDLRLSGEPVAYLIGEREFMSLNFAVGHGVLIPRPETELLVERALLWLQDRPGATIVDVGTGSGAIALSIAANLVPARNDRIIAIDASPTALSWAERNRASLGLTDRVELRHGDLLNGLATPIDLLLANLPYLTPEQFTTSPSIQAEPVEALVSGDDGLDLIRRLFADAPRLMTPGGATGLEMDPSQIGTATSLAHRHFPGATVTVIHDLAGHARHLWIACPG